MRQPVHLVIASLFLVLVACAAAPAGVTSSADEPEIMSVLETQKAAWNAGDIDRFMDGYWQSPDLRFASGGTVTRGFQPTLDRYKQRYSGRAAMGRLDFTELEVVKLAVDAAVVHGRWELTRESDAPSGLFTLVFRKLDGSWKIISDTTTSAD